MLSAQKIKDQIVREKNNLFKSFLIKTPYKFDYGKIKKFKKFNSVIVIGMDGISIRGMAIGDQANGTGISGTIRGNTPMYMDQELVI